MATQYSGRAASHPGGEGRSAIRLRGRELLRHELRQLHFEFQKVLGLEVWVEPVVQLIPDTGQLHVIERRVCSLKTGPCVGAEDLGLQARVLRAFLEERMDLGVHGGIHVHDLVAETALACHREHELLERLVSPHLGILELKDQVATGQVDSFLWFSATTGCSARG